MWSIKYNKKQYTTSLIDRNVLVLPFPSVHVDTFQFVYVEFFIYTLESSFVTTMLWAAKNALQLFKAINVFVCSFHNSRGRECVWKKLTCKIQPKLGADRDVQLWADGLTGKDTVEVLPLYFRYD